MDQATSADQGLLRHEPERRPYTNLDRHRRLSARGPAQKTSASELQSLHDFTDFKPDAVRENTDFTGTLSSTAFNRITRPTESALFARVLNRTVVRIRVKTFSIDFDSPNF